MGRGLPFNDAFVTPRHLLALFLAIILAPALALIYMGWQLAEKDQALEKQRLDERRAQATDLIVVSLQQKLSGLEQQLGNPAEWPRFRADNVRVIVLGIPQRLPEASPEVFQAGENAEHGDHNYPAAIATFQQLAASDDEVVRPDSKSETLHWRKNEELTNAVVAAFKRTLHRSIRTKDATFAGARAQDRVTVHALIKVETRILRDCLELAEAATRTRNLGFHSKPLTCNGVALGRSRQWSKDVGGAARLRGLEERCYKSAGCGQREPGEIVIS